MLYIYFHQILCILYLFYRFFKYCNIVANHPRGEYKSWTNCTVYIIHYIHLKCWRIFLNLPKNRQRFKYILLRSIYVQFPIYSKYTSVTNESFWPFLLPSNVITRNDRKTHRGKSNVSYRNQSLNKSIGSKVEW